MTDNISKTNDEKIALRNNWLKIFVVVIATIVVAVKLWQADFNQVFSGFNFSDLLSLFLALFSITLAVLFYFKATETSNVFYDNTYRFTKDVSEILGRVESGFGERLKHLDEGYSGLKSAVENIPYDKEKAQKEIKEEEEQVEKVENERNQIIEDLAKRASLEEAEKSNLFERLEKQYKELSSAKKELHFMRRRMSNAERLPSELQHQLPNSVRRILSEIIINSLDFEILFDAPTRILNRHLSGVLDNLPGSMIETLSEFHIIDRKSNLTDLGRDVLRSMYHEKIPNK